MVMSTNNINPEKASDQKICIQCKKKIPFDARVCSDCGSYQNCFINKIKFISIIIGFIVVLLTLVIHSVSLWPSFKTTLFPKVGIEVLAFQSNFRLILTNTGDHEVFISHLHYEEIDPQPYINAFKQILSILRNEPVEDLKLKNDYPGALFDKNLDVGISIKPGEVKKRDYKKLTEEVRTFVRNLSDDDWNRLVVIAAGNQRSLCMRPIYFSPKDRRFLQGLRITDDTLNTFPVKGFIHAFSPQLNINIEIPFDVVGAVAIKNNDECINKIKKMTNIETDFFWVPPEGSVPFKIP